MTTTATRVPDKADPFSTPGVRLLVYVAAAALAVQAVHFAEHLLQLAYWFANPTEAPWMTPWAAAGRNGLAPGGNLPLGSELLHLIGNTLFMAGLVAMVLLARLHSEPRTGGRRHLRGAVTIQGFHVVEHVLLTMSVVVFGRAMGFSTLFGLASGPVGSSYRVWFHFAINLAVTLLAVLAFKEMFGRVTNRRQGEPRSLTA